MTPSGQASVPTTEEGDSRQVVVTRGHVTVGWFRARPGEPGFDGGTTARPIVVFPRTAVAIRHLRREEVVADPTTAMLYNPGDVYRRRLIDPVGDHCEWVSIPRAWWAEVGADVDPDGRLHDRRFVDGRVFTTDHCPSPARAYLRQRHLTSGLATGRLTTLEVEELAMTVLREVLAAGAGSLLEARASGPGTRRRHRRLVHDTREFLVGSIAADASLDDIARAVGSSPYHLHRLFRDHTGTTIHRYRIHLRLRASLADLAERDLAAIAHDLGFSSHSHFTATFRREFGVTPSQVRKILTA